MLADLIRENEYLKDLLQEQRIEFSQKEMELDQEEMELDQPQNQMDVLSKDVDEQAFRIKEMELMKCGLSKERFLNAPPMSLFNPLKDAEVEAAVEAAKKQIEAEEEAITYKRRKSASREEEITFSDEVEEQHITI